MPSFQYIGSNGEHIVGLDTSDLTDEQYDALSDALKQAVYINRGSNSLPLYREIPAAESATSAVVEVPAPEVVAPVVEPEPEPTPPLDVPAEGDNS